MTEQRPHYRSRNSLHPKVTITLNEGEGLTQKQREAIQYSNMPNTTFGRAALTCYDGVDTAIPADSLAEKPVDICELPDPEPEFPQD